VPVITTESTPFRFGRAQIFREGKDVTIIACGLMVYLSLVAAEKLQKKGISARVINLHTIKPIDKKAIIKAAKETKCIVTAEEHQLMAGFGSAVAEVVVQNCPVPMEMVGVRDTFGESGQPWELLKKYHLMDGDIVRAVEKTIHRRRRER
jgi:transketolase